MGRVLVTVGTDYQLAGTSSKASEPGVTLCLLQLFTCDLYRGLSWADEGGGLRESPRYTGDPWKQGRYLETGVPWIQGIS